MVSLHIETARFKSPARKKRTLLFSEHPSSLEPRSCFVHDCRSFERVGVGIGLALNTVRTPLQKNFFWALSATEPLLLDLFELQA